MNNQPVRGTASTDRLRQGSATLFSVGVLVVVMALVVVMLHRLSAQRANFDRRTRCWQSRYAAEAAVEHAQQELNADSGYTGEHWQIRRPQQSIPGAIVDDTNTENASPSVDATVRLAADARLIATVVIQVDDQRIQATASSPVNSALTRRTTIIRRRHHPASHQPGATP